MSDTTPEPSKIAEGVYLLTIPFPQGWFPPDSPQATLCYLVKQRNGWLMIDAGLNHRTCFDSLCRQLAELEIPLQDIRWLVVTHYHPDHFGLAGRITAASGAALVMHQRDWSMVQMAVGAANNWSEDELAGWARTLGIQTSELDGYRQVVDFGTRLFPSGVEPSLLLTGDDEPIGDTRHLRAILTPGHSPGHICVYDDTRKIIFSGDHVLLEITTHISPSFVGNDDQLGEYLQSLKKIRGLDVHLVLPAHERPFAQLGRRVDELLQHHEMRLDQVLASVRHRALSVREVASQVEWIRGLWDQMNGTDRLLAIMETLAHLRLLQERGDVTSVDREGTVVYRARSIG